MERSGERTSEGHVDAHTHLYAGLAPLGMPRPAAAPADLVGILEAVWWRLDRALDQRSLDAAARLYVAEALLLGTTALVDHHESPDFIEGSLDVLADACQDLGMRAVLCFGATERNGGRDEARRGLGECHRFLRENDRPLVRGVVGLHAGFTVSDDTLREAGDLARELGTVVHIHLAEAGADVRRARNLGYAGPLDRLLRLDALPPGSILAHGVHLGALDVRACRERGLWLVQNPRSNLANGVGYPPALSESDRVALGTDGFPADMWAEERVLLDEASRRGEDHECAARRLDAGHELVRERFGADAVGVEVLPGQIVVDGRTVVRGGRLQSGDLEGIRARAEEEAPRLWERMEN